MSAERDRIARFGRMEDGLKQSGPWYQWGPHVSERQWGTVREDYSADGNAWNYPPHDPARSRRRHGAVPSVASYVDDLFKEEAR